MYSDCNLSLIVSYCYQIMIIMSIAVICDTFGRANYINLNRPHLKIYGGNFSKGTPRKISLIWVGELLLS